MEQALRQRAASAMAAPALIATDAACSAHIRANRNYPEKVGQALLAGVQAIQAASQFFMRSPPNVTGGVSALGVQLLFAVEGLVPESTRTSDSYAKFRTEWTDAFSTLPTTTQSVQDDLTAFAATGEAEKLVRAIETILVEVTVVMTRFLPQQTGNELATYIGAVSDVFDGVGAGVAAFNTGDAPAAVEAIYKGLRDAANDMIPASLQSDAAYRAVTGLLDSTLGSLSRHVLQYQQQIANSNVCWRGSAHRERERPRVCANDYTWDGVQWCLFRQVEPYTIESVSSSDRYLNIHGGQSHNSHDVQVWNNPGSENTQWHISGPLPDGSYNIQNVAGRTYLSVGGGSSRSGANLETYYNGANLQMYNDPSSNTSRWLLHPTGAAGVFTIENVASGTFVNLPGGSRRGASVKMWDQTAAWENEWRIESAWAHGPFQAVLPRQSLLDTAAAWKMPKGPLPAVCEGSLEKHGSWCYKACRSGYVAAGTRCQVQCGGAYQIESSQMCGKTPGDIAAAMTKMAAGTVTQLVTVSSLIAAMQSGGLDLATSLSGTMQALVDMGKPFAHPPCPV